MQQQKSYDAFELLRLNGDGRSRAHAENRVESQARIRFAVAKALTQGRIGFHFQPVVRADNPKFPAFHEMLARMYLPDGKTLPAGAFLPYVEDGPLGRIIDRLALSEALKTLAENPGLRLSVNVSPESMGDEEWLNILAAASRGSNVCGRLILEITENAAAQNADQMIDFMRYVRKSGCAFALDDFGAGVTGFRHFRDFRFDIVKIDGAFAQGVHASPDNQVLVESLVSIARHFEMMVVAERIENPADAQWLRDNGVDCLQGYLYGRPSEAPLTTDWRSEPVENRAAC